MKTLSGTFAFVVLAVIAIVTVVSCRHQRHTGHRKFTLEIGGPTKDDYVEVRSEKDFMDALKTVCDRKAQYKIHFKHNDNSETDLECPDHIKTSKVTTSKAANNASAGESAANDPHATYRVQSNDPTDIKTVLDTLATPTPTPP